VNTSKISINEMDMFEVHENIEDFENTIIEQMRNTQIEFTPRENRNYEEYEARIDEEYVGGDDYSQPQTQEPMLLDLNEMSAMKPANGQDQENFTNLFETNFEFWNYMEPENWKMSNLTRIKKPHKKDSCDRKQEKDKNSWKHRRRKQSTGRFIFSARRHKNRGRS
jgi:hypothetical protein